jgi:hypothetical protein
MVQQLLKFGAQVALAQKCVAVVMDCQEIQDRIQKQQK